MVRVLVDTSVIVAAAFSDSGASFALVRLLMHSSMNIVVSDYLLNEFRRNLSRDPRNLKLLSDFLTFAKIVEIEVTAGEVAQAAECVDMKDAPVIAAAKKAGVAYLVSLDRRHIVNPEVIECTGLDILTPREFLRTLEGDLNKPA